MSDFRIEGIVELTDRASKQLKQVKNNANSLRSVALKAGGALSAAFSSAALISSFVNINREMERLRANLQTFVGADMRDSAFAFIRDFAARTPYDIAQVTEAFTRLYSLGITPTADVLESFGDIAAGSGKSMIQIAEAVADATVGEFERLKEFGIKARKEGDNISLTFAGVTRTVTNDAESIKQALVELGQTEFGGSMANQMKTINGSISNTMDSWTTLMDVIGGAGIRDIMISNFSFIGQILTDLANFILKNQQNIKAVFVSVGQAIVRVWLEVEYYAKMAFYGVDLLIRTGVDAWIQLFNTAMDKMVSAYNGMAQVFGMDLIDRSSLPQIATAADITVQKINELSQAHRENIRLLNETTDAEFERIISQKGLIMSVDEYKKKLEQEAIAAAAASKAERQRLKQQEEYASSVYGKLEAELLQYRTVVNQTWDAQERLDLAFQNGDITASEYAYGIEHLNDLLSKYDEATESSMDQTSELSEHLKQAARSMQQSMSQFFFDIMQGEMSDLASSFKRTINQMVADLLASKLFTLMLGSFGSTGQLGGLLGAAIPGRASGGPVDSGQPYIVGERGPELFMPASNGTIVPNDVVSSGIAGTSSVSVNIYAWDTETGRAKLENDKRWLAELVNNTSRTYNMR